MYAPIFDLGYRPFEWTCNDLNAPSNRAAERFGSYHEVGFRQHMGIKGANRDAAWFAMTDRDWQRVNHSYERVRQDIEEFSCGIEQIEAADAPRFIDQLILDRMTKPPGMLINGIKVIDLD